MTPSEFRVALDLPLIKDRAALCLEYISDLESKTCATCKYWTRFSDKHNLRKCLGDNGCNVTGDKFFCASWEKIK